MKKNITKGKETFLIKKNDLPPIKGNYQFQFPLAPLTWFQVGGTSDAYVRPKDLQDLVSFLKVCGHFFPITVLGAGSNVLVRDQGIAGMVLKLTGPAFSFYEFLGNRLIVGAGALDRTIALACGAQGLSGLEFLISVPGSIGGAVAMNAGAYGQEIGDCLEWVEGVNLDGEILRLMRFDLSMHYRHGGLANGFIATKACFFLRPDAAQTVGARMEDIIQQRKSSQPTQGKTGGSTFKNPPSQPAWELIDAAGCRGLEKGAAQISPLHCNFLINRGGATSYEIEYLGNTVQQKVHEKTGTWLEWEIIRLGRT